MDGSGRVGDHHAVYLINPATPDKDSGPSR
jgi:hypothetical protein